MRHMKTFAAVLLALVASVALAETRIIIADKIITPESNGFFDICGDATTVNNNTVYYGPSPVVVAGYGQTCDITQAGNTTEATADAPEPAFSGTAFRVVGMQCRLNDPGATVSLTLRSAAAATTPSVTCSIADDATGCVADVQTTVDVALGATVAIAAASSANMGASQFHCRVFIKY